MIYSSPAPGETIFCWRQGSNFISHKHMLYLGDGEVLSPHPISGWDIISLSDLPVGFYRPIGMINISEVKYDGKNPFKVVYKFFDKKDLVEITVKKQNGKWKIEKDFQMPSWVGGEDAGRSRSEEDCGSDVTSLSRENPNQDRDSDRAIYKESA